MDNCRGYLYARFRTKKRQYFIPPSMECRFVMRKKFFEKCPLKFVRIFFIIRTHLNNTMYIFSSITIVGLVKIVQILYEYK